MKLLTENIWDTITRSVKKRKLNYVAVAYFGSDGANLLPLKKGDILVVDASEKTVINGGTDPKSLHILYDKGVRIFSKERLHSKVMVLGKTLFLGSANVSTNSKYYLHEAVIQTDESKLVQECIEYIQNLPKRELEEKDLKYLATVYSPPVHFVSRKKIRVAKSQFRLYSLEIEREGFSQGTELYMKLGREKANQELNLDEILEILEVKLDQTTASLEFIIQFEKKEKGYFFYPPSEVIHKEVIVESNVALLFMARIKKRRGKYREALESKINSKVDPTNQWLSESLSKKLMDHWKLTFNQM